MSLTYLFIYFSRWEWKPKLWDKLFSWKLFVTKHLQVKVDQKWHDRSPFLHSFKMLSTLLQYTSLSKNHFFARIVFCPPFLIHYWTFWMKKLPSNSIFSHWKSLNEFPKFWGSKKYLNAIPISDHIPNKIILFSF